MSLVMGIDLDIVNEESVKHQFIKKIIYGTYKKYGKIVFVKNESVPTGLRFGEFEEDEKDPNLQYYKTTNSNDSLILEKQDNFDLLMEAGFLLGSKNTPLKPDLVFWDKLNKKPHTIIEIINTSAPSAEKYEAYCEADVNYISIFTRDKKFDIDSFFNLIDGQEKRILRFPVKCTQIIKKNLTSGEKMSEILKGITESKYEYVGYFKDFEDLPFIFNKGKDSMEFFPQCRPNFDTVEYEKSSGPIKGSYDLKTKKIPKLVKAFKNFNKDNFKKEIIEELYFKKGIPSSRINSIFKVKVERMIQKYDDPFLSCTVIDVAAGDDSYNILKGKDVKIIYKNNNEEPVETGNTYYFKNTSSLYPYNDTYKIYSEKIVSFEEYDKMKNRQFESYELFYLPILKKVTGGMVYENN